ncbi:GNAT family N-acetyltransferase [Halocatena marina]|uniref:GNAT family N-acetyltransferase n=1 Tax=Halocatena marina TaxID=2934937 RepID=UPI00200F49C5|nr:N-acetyltransferase [Halocatena marina]
MPILKSIQRASLTSPWPALLDSAVHGGATCLVATTTTDTPIGYALSVTGQPETDAVDQATGRETDTEGAQCYLAELAVDPHHRREGYGSSLLKSVIERTDADELLLTARADDTTARGFYETHGFQVIDRLPEHYEHGHGQETERRDGLLLSKPLGSGPTFQS